MHHLFHIHASEPAILELHGPLAFMHSSHSRKLVDLSLTMLNEHQPFSAAYRDKIGSLAVLLRFFILIPNVELIPRTKIIARSTRPALYQVTYRMKSLQSCAQLMGH